MESVELILIERFFTISLLTIRRLCRLVSYCVTHPIIAKPPDHPLFAARKKGRTADKLKIMSLTC